MAEKEGNGKKGKQKTQTNTGNFKYLKKKKIMS